VYRFSFTFTESSVAVIEAHNINFAYNTENVIRDVSVSVERGAFLAIIGPNGAGKSTFLRILGGVLRPQHGIVCMFGQSINAVGRKKRAQYIAFVPQETHFASDFSVEEIVSMGRYPYLSAFQREQKSDREAIEHALEYTETRQFCTRSINSLSSGERQRVVLARALAQEPRILLLDEPTSHLDLRHQYAIMEMLTHLNAEGLTVIIVHHDLNLAGLYCEHLLLMNEGSVYAEGTPQSLLRQSVLHDVYKTDVTVVQHPHKDIPQIFLRPKGDAREHHTQ
jgi:iron complex transport system ATP-binding protein